MALSIVRCHLVQATPGPLLSDVLIGSPILVGEDGAPIAVGHGGGFEFGMDPIGDDPELAMVRPTHSLTHESCSVVYVGTACVTRGTKTASRGGGTQSPARITRSDADRSR